MSKPNNVFEKEEFKDPRPARQTWSAHLNNVEAYELNEERRPLQRQIEVERGRARKLEKQIEVLDKRLADDAFRERAPGSIVEHASRDLSRMKEEKKVVLGRLETFGAEAP
eukprot:4898692-Prymnesium_polylepis.1